MTPKFERLVADAIVPRIKRQRRRRYWEDGRRKLASLHLTEHILSRVAAMVRGEEEAGEMECAQVDSLVISELSA